MTAIMAPGIIANVNTAAAAAANTAMINHACEQALLNRKRVQIPGGVIYHDGMLLNEGVPMEGVGRNMTVLAPYATFPANTPQLRVRPRNGHYLDNLSIAHILLWSDYDGTRRCTHSLEVMCDLVTNMTGAEFAHVYARGSLDYSARLINHPNNIQGVPANSLFKLCQFWEGFHATYHGDNLHFDTCVFRSTGDRQGLRVYATDTDGVAGHLTAANSNFDCAGGAALVLRGRNVKFLNNNAEQTCGAGPNGAVFDLDGSSGLIGGMSQFIGNHIGMFGACTAHTALRVNGVDGLKIDDYDFASALETPYGIDVTAAAQNIVVGHGKIAGFQMPIHDPFTRVTQVNAV